MRYISDTHNWWTSPFDGDDAWENDEVDKQAYYEKLCSWRKDQVDALETDEEKDELMHKFWLKDQKDLRDEENRDRIF